MSLFYTKLIRNLNSTFNPNSPLLCNPTYSQVLGMRMLTTWQGHYSAYHKPFLLPSLWHRGTGDLVVLTLEIRITVVCKKLWASDSAPVSHFFSWSGCRGQGTERERSEKFRNISFVDSPPFPLAQVIFNSFIEEQIDPVRIFQIHHLGRDFSFKMKKRRVLFIVILLTHKAISCQ